VPKQNLTRLSPLPLDAQFALRELGGRIAQARKERSLSQSEVADMLGISKNTYLSVEHGRPSAQMGHYARVIWLLDVEGSFLAPLAGSRK
jgi:transcriptional regulator with XRE-family HTH domain